MNIPKIEAVGDFMYYSEDHLINGFRSIDGSLIFTLPKRAIYFEITNSVASGSTIAVDYCALDSNSISLGVVSSCRYNQIGTTGVACDAKTGKWRTLSPQNGPNWYEYDKPGTTKFAVYNRASGTGILFNFGDKPFAHEIPKGFTPYICNRNLLYLSENKVYGQLKEIK